MPASSPGSITHFFGKMRGGDPSAMQPLWQRYFPRMSALARKTLGKFPQRAADADDVVQSAFLSFWKRVERGGANDIFNRHDLWKLLGTITVRKAVKQIQREQTLKRGGGRLLNSSSAVENGQAEVSQSLLQLPTVELDLTCDELLRQLDDDLRVIMLLKLLGYQNSEIASWLECTVRRIQRKLQLVRDQWINELS